MEDQEVKLMKGNEAIAHAAIRCGADGYFGYPITPQSEIIETLALLKPWETTGMVVLQAESEVASINMLYGGAGAGKRVLTSSSSPGVALMQEGISYMAGAELPGVIVNVQRGGPGLGTIQPSQSDYNQATRGGGNGDYNVIVLAPASVQEMADFVDLAFELAFKYRNPAMILSDGVIGQMMEKVVLPPIKPRRTEEEIEKESIYVLNKLSSDYEIMRNTHIPSILKTVSYNERMQNDNLKLYEIAAIFKEKENLEYNKELKEETILTICRTLNKKLINFDSAGSKMNYQESDIYLLKKDAEKILHYIGINKFNIIKNEKNSILHAGQTIDYMIGNKKIVTLRKSKKTC